MKLQTKQLKTFNSIAGGMKQNNVLPILSYLKFDDGYITKNNLESFVTMEAEFKGRCLIDEKILMSIVNATKEEFIDVEIKEKSVILTYGKKKDTSPTDDISNFPENSESDGNEVELPSNILNSVKIASNFTLERDDAPYAGCVFIGNGIVGATSGYIGYTKKYEGELPEVILEKNAIGAVRNFDTVSYSENGSYQFFTNHIFKFGFIKKDTKYLSLLPFSKIPEGEKVTIDKSEILEFCEVCVNSSQGKALVATVRNKMLSMIDADYGHNIDHPISVSLPDFSFNPILMGKLLKSVPDELLTFVKATNKYFITGDSGFVSLIMEMQS